MPAKIPTSVREEVFQSYLGGLFRHQIAIKHGVSEATVSNVVAEYRLRYGSELIDQLRALSLAMSRSGLSFSECAKGHRIEMVLRNMGADEGQFEEFILKLWELYTKTGLAPNQLVNEINELHYFRECNQSMKRAGVSIPKICADIRMKQNELKSLETNCDNVRAETSDLLHQKAAIEDEIKFNKELKEKLNVKGLQTNELLDTADLAALVKKSGYSIREVKERFVTFSELDRACAIINDKVLKEGIRNDQLKRHNEFLEEKKSKSSQRLRELELLEMKGFGLKEFKMLNYLLDEIAEQTGTSTDSKAAVKAFFDGFNSYFYDYIDLKKKVAELEEKRNVLNVSMNLGQDIVEGLELLARKGLKKGDLKTIFRFVVQNCIPSAPRTTVTSRTATTTSLSDVKSGQVGKNIANSKDAENLRANQAGSVDGAEVSAHNDDCYSPITGNEKYSNEKCSSDPHSEDLKKKTLEYDRYKDMEGAADDEEEEFYGKNILDTLAHLQKKYNPFASTSTSSCVPTSNIFETPPNHSRKPKENDLAGHLAVGIQRNQGKVNSGLNSASQARSESEELNAKKYGATRTNCHRIVEPQRNPKISRDRLRKSILSLQRRVEPKLSHKEVYKHPHLAVGTKGIHSKDCQHIVDQR
jgi:hypothetical protein